MTMGRITLFGLAAALVVAATVWAMRGRPAPATPSSEATAPSEAAPTTAFPLGSATATPASLPSPAAAAPAAPNWVVTREDAPATPAPETKDALAKPLTDLARYQSEWKNMRERSRRTREEILKAHDKDGDGELNREEARAARRDMREQGRAARESFMNRFDADGDGELSEAERNEVRRYFRASRAALTADANGDGVLDSTETAIVLERIKSGRRTGDLNGDGRTDAADAAILLEWAKNR